MEIFNIVKIFAKEDKILHFSISAVILIFDFGVRYYGKINPRLKQALFYAVRDTILIGIVKELKDSLGPGNPQLTDIIADVMGLLFPVYIFLAYRETRKFTDSPLFDKSDDISQAIVRRTSVAVKEVSESLGSYIEYRLMCILVFFAPHIASKRDIWEHRNEALNDGYDAQIAIQRWFKAFWYRIRFLLNAVVDFIIDFVKMPFWVLAQTVYVFFESILFALKRFKPKQDF